MTTTALPPSPTVTSADLASDSVPDHRRREWNRAPLQSLFPRIPDVALERVLDLCIAKNFVYDLSRGKWTNAKRYTAIVVAHVRHFYTDYDRLLRVGDLKRDESGGSDGGEMVVDDDGHDTIGEGVEGRGSRLERYEARKRTGPKVWKVLREWCPWDADNEVLKKCFEATLVRPEERGSGWDPMDVDDSDYEVDVHRGVEVSDDLMDLD